MKYRRYSLAPIYPKKYISQRQAKCLVTLLETLGNRRVIAAHMNISYRTVEQYLQQLRNIFECHSKKEIIDQAKNIPWQEWVNTLDV